MNRNPTVISVVAALAVAVGLIGEGTAASASPPALSAKLLSIGQMPAGWRALKASSSGGIGCLANLLEPKGIKQTANATTEFEGTGGAPIVDEKLATYTSAKTGYDKVVAHLSACKHFSGTSGGQKVTDGTLKPFRFPHYGNTSEAFVASYKVQTTTVRADLVVVREANVVMGIDEANISTVDLAQFRGFVKKATNKLG